MDFFPDPYLYIVLCLCSHVMLWIWFICVQRKQLEWGRTAVQAERPSCLGFCMGECLHHMHSNSSMRCLVFPDRICLRVLYLSRPARMFSAWMTSFTVFLVSSRALANSELKAWKCIDDSIYTPQTLSYWTYDSLYNTHYCLWLCTNICSVFQLFAVMFYCWL